MKMILGNTKILVETFHRHVSTRINTSIQQRLNFEETFMGDILMANSSQDVFCYFINLFLYRTS